MYTLRQILDHIKGRRKIRIAEGSCFGVTDPSRLRPESPRRVQIGKDEKPGGRSVEVDVEKFEEHLKGK